MNIPLQFAEPPAARDEIARLSDDLARLRSTPVVPCVRDNEMAMRECAVRMLEYVEFKIRTLQTGLVMRQWENIGRGHFCLLPRYYDLSGEHLTMPTYRIDGATKLPVQLESHACVWRRKPQEEAEEAPPRRYPESAIVDFDGLHDTRRRYGRKLREMQRGSCDLPPRRPPLRLLPESA